MKEDDDDIQEYISYRKAFPKEYDAQSLSRMQDRNEVLEEVAKAVHGFKAFEKDTMDSFAAYIRGLKR